VIVKLVIICFMKTLRQTFLENLVWFITTLVAIGAFAATIKIQGESINEIGKEIVYIKSCQNQNDIEHARFETVIDMIKELKADVKEIKSIILKPAIH